MSSVTASLTLLPLSFAIGQGAAIATTFGYRHHFRNSSATAARSFGNAGSDGTD
jgi:hypothetical protein